MLGSQRVKVLGIVLIINKMIICFSQVSHPSKYAIEKVREQSPFATSIISQDFMSFVFLFLDRMSHITVFIFLLGLNHVFSKSYLLELKRSQLNVSCGLRMKRNWRQGRHLLMLQNC